MDNIEDSFRNIFMDLIVYTQYSIMGTIMDVNIIDYV